MTSLLLVLLPIALLDSTSMIPLAVVPLAIMLVGRQPILTATGFLAGIFVVYLGGGILIAIGLEALIDALEPAFIEVLRHPTDLELGLQLVLGIVMIGFGWRIADSRLSSKTHRERKDTFSLGKAFALGATLTIIGVPGAVPYFGGIDLILRADLDTPGAVAALLFYNLVFVAPLAALIGTRVLFPTHSERIFAVVASFCEVWGKRLVILILLVLGATLTADAIGWWMGQPLLPVS